MIRLVPDTLIGFRPVRESERAARARLAAQYRRPNAQFVLSGTRCQRMATAAIVGTRKRITMRRERLVGREDAVAFLDLLQDWSD